MCQHLIISIYLYFIVHYYYYQKISQNMMMTKRHKYDNSTLNFMYPFDRSTKYKPIAQNQFARMGSFNYIICENASI